MSIIGKMYEPYDNSYCRSLIHGNPACIVQPDEESVREGYMITKELGAKFVITSDPYDQYVASFIGGIHRFINVKSDKTGIEYRTLYSEHCVK